MSGPPGSLTVSNRVESLARAREDWSCVGRRWRSLVTKGINGRSEHLKYGFLSSPLGVRALLRPCRLSGGPWAVGREALIWRDEDGERQEHGRTIQDSNGTAIGIEVSIRVSEVSDCPAGRVRAVREALETQGKRIVRRRRRRRWNWQWEEAGRGCGYRYQRYMYRVTRVVNGVVSSGMGPRC